MGVNALLGSSVDRTIESHQPLLFALMDLHDTPAVMAVLRVFAPAIGKEILDNVGKPLTGRVINR
jgi:hypothetical protein